METKILNKEQLKWIDEVSKDLDIIFMSIHGSHLYGLNRVGSDVDIKAVYRPTNRELLLGGKPKVINKKNEELNIEIEIKSLSSFLRSLDSADTNCVDLLFTPPQFTLKTSGMWNKIIRERKHVVSRDMKGIIGYIKTHANKYSNKIKRYDEMKELLEFIIANPEFKKVRDILDDFDFNLMKFKYIQKVKVDKKKVDNGHDYLEICGKKYIDTWTVGQVVEALEREIDRFGNRTKEGSVSGLDTKSLSHAIRVLVQLQELLLFRDITFPLKEKSHILKIKRGQIPLNEVMEEIEDRFELCMDLIEIEDLPENTIVDRIISNLEIDFFGAKKFFSKLFGRGTK